MNAGGPEECVRWAVPARGDDLSGPNSAVELGEMVGHAVGRRTAEPEWTDVEEGIDEGAHMRRLALRTEP